MIHGLALMLLQLVRQMLKSVLKDSGRREEIAIVGQIVQREIGTSGGSNNQVRGMLLTTLQITICRASLKGSSMEFVQKSPSWSWTTETGRSFRRSKDGHLQRSWTMQLERSTSSLREIKFWLLQVATTLLCTQSTRSSSGSS